MLDASDILQLYRTRGDIEYADEGVSQIVHGWQCAQLALQAGAPASLQLAAWLHDIGHLFGQLNGTPTLQGIDDCHQDTGASLLQPLWGDAVAEPVRLHVAAKRYLVSAHPQYLTRLSGDSQRSLALQGGPMSEAECADFLSLPFAQAAQKLRGWDDLGKRADWFARDREHALDELQKLMHQVSQN